MTTELILLLVGAYLLGAVPFGLLIGLARGVDVRTAGSRNIGATNVGRVVGRPWGYLCLGLDILKGMIPALLAGKILIAARDPLAAELLAWIAVAAAAVIGHTFPIYLGFRGGKGVATTIGAALGVWPYFTVAMLAALVAYAFGRKLTGIVSVGSLSLAVAFPLAVWAYIAATGMLFQRGWPLIAAAAAMGGLIIVRHRANIARLLRGQEPRVSGSRSGATTPSDSPR